VSDSCGWVTDDVLLLSLSLSAVLTRSLKSIATPLIFQRVHLNCVPKAEASAAFYELSRILIPGLDSAGNETPVCGQSVSPACCSADRILQHPNVQHKNTSLLRSFDVLEWLELSQQQLEAACSFEIAEIPNLLVLRKQDARRAGANARAVGRSVSAADRWQMEMNSGLNSTARPHLMHEELISPKHTFLLKELEKTMSSRAKVSEERASFCPLHLILRMTSQRNSDESQARDLDHKVNNSSRIYIL
jgi:hypothetical protein